MSQPILPFESPKRSELAGRRWGALTATGRSERRPNKKGNGRYTHYEVLCDCGKVIWVPSTGLTTGTTKGCGCPLSVRNGFAQRERHGAGMPGTPHYQLYTVWTRMRHKCSNPAHDDFKHYGGRGITVCQEWQESFTAFRDWALTNGYSEGLEIDRYPDNNGNYEPTNCRWATRSQQMRNTRKSLQATAFGETKSIHDWADDPRCNVTGNTLSQRLRHGMKTEWSITTPSTNPNSGRRRLA